LVEAHEGKSETVVVDAELVKDGGAEVADGDFVFDNVVRVVVGFAVNGTAFDSSPCHPGGEASWVVVAAVVVTLKFALAVGGTTEFAGEDDEGVSEHAALS